MNNLLKKMDKGLWAAWGLGIGFGVVFSWLTLLRHWAFNTHAFDLGIFHHVVWNTSVGNWFEHTYHTLTFPNLINHLGDHVQPILWPISWLYVFHDGAETLLVLQAFVVGNGVVPVFLLARTILHRTSAALLFGLIYAMHPALHAALLFDFHPIVMAIPWLLWAFYFAQEKRYRAMSIAALLVLFSKENLSLVIALFGVYLMLKRQYKPGLSLFLGGIAWFAFCFFVILPTFNPGQGSTAFYRYSYLGNTWFDIAVNLITHPQIVWQKLSEPLSIKYLQGLFVPLGLLSLFAPQVMLVAVSELGLNLFSSLAAQRTINYQYSAMNIAVLVVASIYGVQWLAKQQKKYLPSIAYPIVMIAPLLALAMSITFHYRNYGSLRPWGLEYRDSYQITEHDKLANRFLAQIPPDAIISAQSDLASHVSQREIVYVFPTVLDAEYVFLDFRSLIFPVHLFPIEGLTPEEAYREYIRRLFTEDGFALLDYEDGWLLLERNEGNVKTIPPVVQRFLEEGEIEGISN